MAGTASADMCGWRGEAVSVSRPRYVSSATVFSSPHSGRRYPEIFRRTSRLGDTALRASEDAFVDDIFSLAPRYGAPLVAAQFPRAYIDVNRAADELDPALIDRFASRRPRTLRVSAGLGVVPRIVAENTPIYDGKLTMDEVTARIDCCYHPYHRILADSLDHAYNRYGIALLIDCHSMPADPSRRSNRRAEIIIGDCYGASAGGDMSDAAFALFRGAGFRVARNAPFAGGYITQRYGKPRQGVHAIQIEIDRGLYLDQKRMVPTANYQVLKSIIEPIVAELAALPLRLGSALAAE